jgi:hypothetical protein
VLQSGNSSAKSIAEGLTPGKEVFLVPEMFRPDCGEV